jgi:hypothetical protein
MKLAVRILVTYLVLLFLFMGAVARTCAIPRSEIEGNMRQSVQEVVTDGQMFTWQVGFFKPYIVGVFTECLMLDIAYCVDTDQPMQSAMENKFYMADGSPVTGIQTLLSDPGDPHLQPVIYSRYWHGSQCLLRPLLRVTTMRGIRMLNIFLLALLLIATTAVMIMRLGMRDALIISLSLLLVMVPTVPLCLNYVPTFVIALLASLVILLWDKPTAGRGNAVVLFFVIGGVAAFMDLLTTPLVAMAVPLTVYMLLRQPDDACRTLMVMALAWLAGYALLWASKWALAAMMTDFDVFGDAMGAVTQRTVGHGEQDYWLWCLKRTLGMLAAVAVLTAAVTWMLGNVRQALRDNGWMLLIAASGFVWALVLLEHTWHHLHFTWRMFVVPFIALTLFLSHSFEERRRQLRTKN